MQAPGTSGSFPAAPVSPLGGAQPGVPFTVYTGANTDPLETTWTNPPIVPTASGSWPALQHHDILDDPAPAAPSSDSWPAFEPQQPAAAPRSSYPASYEVRAGWAVADDSDPLTGPSPATGTPTAPARAVSAYDDVLSAPSMQPAPQHFAYETGDITSLPPGQIAQTFAYETGDFTSIPPGQMPAGWGEPPANNAAWPNYGGTPEAGARAGRPQGGPRAAGTVAPPPSRNSPTTTADRRPPRRPPTGGRVTAATHVICKAADDPLSPRHAGQ